jgi:hypothetical protein
MCGRRVRTNSFRTQSHLGEPIGRCGNGLRQKGSERMRRSHVSQPQPRSGVRLRCSRGVLETTKTARRSAPSRAVSRLSSQDKRYPGTQAARSRRTRGRRDFKRRARYASSRGWRSVRADRRVGSFAASAAAPRRAAYTRDTLRRHRLSNADSGNSHDRMERHRTAGRPARFGKVLSVTRSLRAGES